MFNSSILDVIIGLVFCFASVALFVSSINEAAASMLKLRHKTLLTGLQRMLNDPSGNGLVKTLYEHALINPLTLAMPPMKAIIDPKTASGAGMAQASSPPPDQEPLAQKIVKPSTPSWRTGELPAYIASKDFAHALVDIVQTAPKATGDLKADIGEIDDPQLRQALQGFLARAGGDIDKFSDAIANWFDSAMDRLSGTYKRRAQVWTFVFGLFTAGSLNIDAFHVLNQLWQRPALSAAIVSPSSTHLIAAAEAESRKNERSKTPASGTTAASTSTQAPTAGDSDSAKIKDDATTEPGALSPDKLMTTLNTLPVGWGYDRHIPTDCSGIVIFYLEWILGIAITASAAVFGAPFWFDLLQQLIQIRGTGAKPATNSDKKKPEVTSHATP